MFNRLSTYTFSTKAPAILGSVIDNVVLDSICGYNTALKTDPSIAVKYKQIYPGLEPGFPVDPTFVDFYIFKTLSGEDLVIASPWVLQSSIVLKQHLNANISVANVTSSDIDKIRIALCSLNIAFNLEIL